MAALRIGVNALYLIPGQVGGTEIYLRNLLSALAGIDSVNEYFLFTNRETGPDLAPRRANFHLVPQPVRAVIRPLRIAWEQTLLPAAAARLRLDVLLNPGFTAPLVCPCPMVTVFHDLQHKRHPEHFRWFDLPFWNVLLYGSAKRSRELLADSDATRADVLHFYGLDERRVTTAPLGVEEAFFAIARRRNQASPPYVLAVSTLHPHKNLDGLLRAFAVFSQARPEYRLVVAGLRGFHSEELERLRVSLGLLESVRFTGWIPREELYELYAGAAAFVYPSTFEGFGLPLVEALAAGVPTACSNVQPLAGIAGEAALLFDPSDTGEIAAALERLVADDVLRKRLASAGPAEAARFSWKTTAERTLEALARAAATR
jgi:glycosyltransferase involved in cell wall biosynthesis